MAKALLNARVGDKIRFQAPVGEMRLAIVNVEYPQG
jgi:transcription elongation GreA/GreB family factor